VTEPKNSLVKQFQQVLAMDGVELVIDEARSKRSLTRPGARHRRARTAIHSRSRLVGGDVRRAGRTDVLRCVVTADSVRDKVAPIRIAKGDAHPSRELTRALHDVRRRADVLESHVDYELVAPNRREVPTLQPSSTPGDARRSAARLPTIHVTGTNGKGTTTTLTSALLSATGLRVGAFTSPDCTP